MTGGGRGGTIDLMRRRLVKVLGVGASDQHQLRDMIVSSSEKLPYPHTYTHTCASSMKLCLHTRHKQTDATWCVTAACSVSTREGGSSHHDQRRRQQTTKSKAEEFLSLRRRYMVNLCDTSPRWHPAADKKAETWQPGLSSIRLRLNRPQVSV